MATIESVRFQNFKSFSPESPEVKLSNLNVLIGANNSGKSNFVDGFRLLNDIPTDISACIRNLGGRNVLCAFSEQGQNIQATTVIREEENQLISHHIEIAIPDLGKAVVLKESVEPEDTVLKQVFRGIYFYDSWNLFRKIGSERTDAIGDRLLSDGSNLQLVLQNNFSDQDARARLLTYLKILNPSFRDFFFRIVEGFLGMRIEEDGLTGPIALTQLSIGSIHFLSLVAILLCPLSSSVIIIEEPEIGLHPHLIHKVAELIVEASKRTQVIITTHSDLLISNIADFAGAEAILVCERDPNVGTTLRRLDPKELSTWLEEYGLGQLWLKGMLGGTSL